MAKRIPSTSVLTHRQSCADQTRTRTVVQSEQILTCRICGLDWWIYTQLCFNAPPCIFRRRSKYVRRKPTNACIGRRAAFLNGYEPRRRSVIQNDSNLHHHPRPLLRFLKRLCNMKRKRRMVLTSSAMIAFTVCIPLLR